MFILHQVSNIPWDYLHSNKLYLSEPKRVVVALILLIPFFIFAGYHYGKAIDEILHPPPGVEFSWLESFTELDNESI